MKPRLAVAAAILAAAISFSAWAGEQTVVLDVQHADCALCGPIVKRSLERVRGVSSVAVSQPNEKAEIAATVLFDDAVTTVAALIAATTNAGYPAAVRR